VHVPSGRGMMQTLQSIGSLYLAVQVAREQIILALYQTRPYQRKRRDHLKRSLITAPKMIFLVVIAAKVFIFAIILHEMATRLSVCQKKTLTY